MKLEQSERFFVEGLFKKTVDKGLIEKCILQTVDKLTGDASTRRYYRVETDKTSYCVCLDDPIFKENGGNDFFIIQKALEDNSVLVPKIYDTNYEKGYLLEEDLGDVTLLQRLSEVDSIDVEYKLYQESIDQLIIIHSIDSDKYREENFTKRFFDNEKLQGEVLFTIKFFLRRLLNYNLSAMEEMKIISQFIEICSHLVDGKKVLTHRDYHSRNIMVKNDKLVIIDFQDARFGIPQYDLSSLLEDCYYQIDFKNVEKLKKYYWKKLQNITDQYKDYDDFLYKYDLMAIQRVFKAIGSFAYIYAKRKDIRYLKYIGFGFEKLKIILFKYPQYSELRKILGKMYYES